MSDPEKDVFQGGHLPSIDEIDKVSEIIFGDNDLYTRMRDELYAKYAYLPRPEHQGRNVDFYKMALAALELRPDDRLLDLCCGSGKFTRMVANSGHQGEIMGVDRSSGAIELAEHILATKGLDNVSYEVGDARDLSFVPADSINKLTINYGLYHMVNPRGALQEAHRVLTPGGTIVVLTRGSLNLKRQWGINRQLVEKMGYTPSDSPYLNFDAESAWGPMSEFFVPYSYPPFEELVEPGTNSVQRTMRIDANGWEFYSQTLSNNVSAVILSQMDGSADMGIEGEVRTLIDQEVKPRFFGEINTEPGGYFTDYAQDRLLRGLKP